VDYLINENKLRQLVFNLLDNSQLKHCDESEPWAGGGTPYYVWTSNEDEGEYWTDPDIGFVYYDHPNSYDFLNTYEDDMFPLVEILEPYCTLITDFLPENLALKYAAEWFEKEIKEKVKSVHCG